MTTMANTPFQCSVCGGTTSFQTIMSTNAIGSPDLDLRPPEMQRSTMSAWVQTCPHCGYASTSIDRPTSVTKAWLSSSEYASVADVSDGTEKTPLPVLAKEFYMSSKCYLADGSLDDAVTDLICAAWACDDAGEDAAEYARKFRLLAADAMEKMLEAMEAAGEQASREIAETVAGEADDDQPAIISTRLRLVDVLRRAGELDRAAAQCSQVKRELSAGDYDHIMAVIAAYDQDLIDKGDTSCHTVMDAVEAEASLRDVIHDIGRHLHPKA